MQYQPRRLWLVPYWFFLTTSFCIVGFLLLTAAMGYRYNPEYRRWQKTSMLVLDIDPKNSTIKLDGIAYAINGPDRLTNILPGSYDIEITKEGYIPWQKRIALHSGLVEELEPITLFYDTPIEMPSSTNDRVLIEQYIPDTRVRIIDGELRYGTQLITRFAEAPTSATLLPTGNHAAYIKNDEVHIIELTGNNDQVVYRRSTTSPTPVIARGNELIFQDEGVVRVLRIR